jgi:hypothetical protein
MWLKTAYDHLRLALIGFVHVFVIIQATKQVMVSQAYVRAMRLTNTRKDIKMREDI